jgi:predicted nucleic acid-binding protein
MPGCPEYSRFRRDSGLITDDHAARAEARRRGVRASSTVGVIAHLVSVNGTGVDAPIADACLQTSRPQAGCT